MSWFSKRKVLYNGRERSIISGFVVNFRLLADDLIFITFISRTSRLYSSLLIIWSCFLSDCDINLISVYVWFWILAYDFVTFRFDTRIDFWKNLLILFCFSFFSFFFFLSTLHRKHRANIKHYKLISAWKDFLKLTKIYKFTFFFPYWKYTERLIIYDSHIFKDL